MKFTESHLLLTKLREFFPLLDNDEIELSKAYFKVITFYNEEFCKNLKKVRLEKMFNQKDIVRILKVTPTSYSAWETGLHLPKIEYIKAISEILQVDPSVFITFEHKSVSTVSTVPILDKSFFAHSSFPDIQSIVNNPKENGIRSFHPVCTGADIDFCFDAGNCSAMNGRDGISPRFLVACKASHLKGKSKEEIFNSVNGSVCVVSVNGGEGLLRQVFFDGTVLKITSIDNTAEARIFPVKLGYLASLYGVSVIGEILLAETVEVFGVAIEGIVKFN